VSARSKLTLQQQPAMPPRSSNRVQNPKPDARPRTSQKSVTAKAVERARTPPRRIADILTSPSNNQQSPDVLQGSGHQGASRKRGVEEEPIFDVDDVDSSNEPDDDQDEITPEPLPRSKVCSGSGRHKIVYRTHASRSQKSVIVSRRNP